jgi:hypothetical protein
MTWLHEPRAGRAAAGRRESWIWLALLALALAIGLMAIPPWRRHTVYRALAESRGPSFWWPLGWRHELETSLLLEGQVKHPTEGTLELVSEPSGRVFRTAIKGGRYSFRPDLLPAGEFKARCLTAEGTASHWVPTGTLEPGLHRLNLSFR